MLTMRIEANTAAGRPWARTTTRSFDSVAADAHRYADQQHEKEAGHHDMIDGMSGDSNFDPDRRVMPRMAPVS